MDITTLRTGKLAPKNDPRTLRLASFIDPAAIPPAPASLDYFGKVKTWGMYGNDTKGDCTIAAAGHEIKLFGALAGKPASPALRTILAVYNKLSPQDQGCVMLDVLNYWRKTGIGGHKLFAFAALDLKNAEHVKLSLSLFGGVYLGVNLPISAQDQTGPGKAWDVTSLSGSGTPGSWGGHAINVVAYDPDGVDVITWGAKQHMTWAFFDTYGDEAWAVLTADWANAPKTSGIDFPALQAELANIGRPA